jgi:hypothetical protein
MANRIAMFLLGATLALGFTMAAYLISGAIRSVRDDTGIKVKGYAETTVKADAARWRLSVSARAKVLKDCYDILARDAATVRARLAGYGFADAEVAVFAARVDEEVKLNEKGVRTNEVEGYRITQDVEVSTSRPEAIDGASKRITELLAQGVHVVSGAPQYTFTRLEGLKLELLGAAAHNAAERARTMASKAGGGVGRIRSASQGVFQIVPVGSTETSDYGTYDTSTIDKTVKAVVTIDFALDR